MKIENNIVLLNHKIDYKYQWHWDSALASFSWVKSKNKNRYYLMRNIKKIKEVYIFNSLCLLLLVGITGSFFPFLYMLGIYLCVCLFLFIVVCFKLQRTKTYPLLPIAVLDLDRSFICFIYRKKLACSQSPGNKLQIPFDSLLHADLILTRMINDGKYTIRQVVGYATWKALYLEYKLPTSMTQRDLVLVGMHLDESIYEPIVNAGKIAINLKIGEMNFLR